MYPKFIELHYNGETASVNVADIGIFKDGEFQDVSGKIYPIDETYEEVKQLIHDASCIIAKADPRLDNKPLTMDDLQGMEGEPVWNSNSRQWMLVNKVVGGLKIPDKHIVWMVKNNSLMEVMKEDDLIKFPLYRMKGGR